MPWGLKRYYGTGSLHFITWSCYQREPLLNCGERRDLLLAVLERMRERYHFAIIGYVVMPEHVHLLVSEPRTANPSTVVQAVKLGFTRRALSGIAPETPHRVWQSRFYDFNLWSQRKEIEKLKYMHRNPVSGHGAVTGLTRVARLGWCGSTIGLGGRRRFEIGLDDSRTVKIPTSRAKNAREMGHPFLPVFYNVISITFRFRSRVG